MTRSQISLSRFHIIEGTPPCSPGKCVVCGTVEGVFLDFGFDLDYYGVVYFCLANCFQEAANALDYHSPRQWKMIMDAYSDMRVKFNSLIDENERLKDALAAFSNLNLLNTPDSVPEFVVVEEPEDSSASIERGDSKTDKAEYGHSKQTNESGFTDLQCDDSLNEFLDSI